MRVKNQAKNGAKKTPGHCPGASGMTDSEGLLEGDDFHVCHVLFLRHAPDLYDFSNQGMIDVRLASQRLFPT